MAFGSPTAQALTFPVVPNAMTQGAQAAAAAPQQNADAAAKLAEAKAAEATAKNTTAEAPGALEAAKSKDASDQVGSELSAMTANDNILARLVGKPGWEKSPMAVKMATERFKTLGIQMPKNEMGMPDTPAIQAMLAPPARPWQEVTAQQKKDEAAQKPGDRPFHPGQPEDWQTRASITPLSEKQAEYIHTPVVKAEALFAAGKGNTYNLAQNLLAAAKYERSQLKAHGEDTASVDGILTEDGTALRPDYLKQKAADVAQGTLDKERALGIHYANEDKVAQERIDQKTYEWSHPSAYQKMQISLGDRKVAAQAARASVTTGLAQANLAARLQSMQYAQTRGDITLAGTIARDAQTAIGNAETRLTTTSNVLNNMSQNSHMRKSPQYQALLDQATDLQSFITTNGPAFQATAENARGDMSRMYQNITGNQAAPAAAPATNINVNVSSPGAAPGQQYGRSAVPPGAKPAATLKGKPIFLVGNKYIFADGSDAK